MIRFIPLSGDVVEFPSQSEAMVFLASKGQYRLTNNKRMLRTEVDETKLFVPLKKTEVDVFKVITIEGCIGVLEMDT